MKDEPYTLEDLKKVLEDVKMHDKDKFMLLNMIEAIEDSDAWYRTSLSYDICFL